MSQNNYDCSDRCDNWMLSMAKCIANWIITHPLYITYIIFFSPYILKLLCFLSPLLILLLATTLCAFSTFISNNFRIRHNETQENASNDPLEAEAYKIIFDTFHDSETSLPNESDEVEVYKQINIEALAPEIVKSCFSSTPLHDPPLHETLAKTDISFKDELSKNAIFNSFHNSITNVASSTPENVKSCCSSTPLQDPPLHEIVTETDISFDNEPSTNTKVTTFHNSETNAAKKSDKVEASKHINNLEALAPELVKSQCTSIQPQDPLFHDIVTQIANCSEENLSIKAAKSEDETEIIIKHMMCIKINNQQTESNDQFKAAVEVQINKPEILPFTTAPKTGSTDLHKTSRSDDFSNTKSMRKEKEWTRTLACKLFEERHNTRSGFGEDGMDMLWETLEDEPIKSSAKSDQSIRVCEDEEEEDDADVDEEDDDVAGSEKMCCLQVLKISSGKVNLGIKSRNMIKFSKVLRGFGWLRKTSNGEFRK